MSTDYALIGLIVCAFALWYFAFQTEVWNFWVRLSLAATLLAISALILTPDRTELFRARWRDLWVGIISALALYAIFWVGKQIALVILPFAADQIQNVYTKREQLDLLSIGLLLFFLLGPSEEIFWRGFVQRRLSQHVVHSSASSPLHPFSTLTPSPSPLRGRGETGVRGLGERSAWLVTTALYALVHIWTLNFILIAAAGVAWLFWGWLYQREQSLLTVIISHALWDVLIFVLFPLL